MKTLMKITLHKLAFITLISIGFLLQAQTNSISMYWISDSSELSQVQDLYKRTFTDLYKKKTAQELVDFSIHDLDTIFAQDIEHFKKNAPFSHAVFAKLHNKIVGFAIVEEIANSQDVFIEYIVVNPNIQRQNVGKKLLTSILNKFCEKRKILLVCRKTNLIGCNFYKKNGFIESEFPKFLNWNHPELYYGFELDL